MGQSLILGLGEVLWDCFPDEERPGGAPANFSYHAAQLGYQGGVLSRVGMDERGEKLVRWLAEKGVRTDWIQRDPDHPTGTVTVDVSRPDHPQFIIHENVAWDFMEASPEWRAAVGSAVAVCFGTLAQRNPHSRETIQGLLAGERSKRLIVYDVNLRQKFYSREIVENSLRLASLVKLNEEEAHVLHHLLEFPGTTELAWCQYLLEHFGVEGVCVTRGARGCLVVDQTGWAAAPGIEVRVADTVGAGDAFTAGWVAARLRGWDVAKQAHFANAIGALVASLPGAMPPVGEEYRQLLEQFGDKG